MNSQYVHLRTGQLFFTAGPALVEAVLGSSLAVVMLSRRRRLSAICHGFLPRCLKREGCAGHCAQAGLIVECSVMIMADRFRSSGIPPEEIKVKVYGGSEILDPSYNGTGPRQLGRQNAIAALEQIEAEGLTLSVLEVGGSEGRRLMFDTDNSEVRILRQPFPSEE